MKIRSWTLGRRITALSAAVAVTLGLIAISATVTATANRAATAHVMDRLTPALINMEKLYTGLLRQQSSMRTYALTGVDSDLTSYRDALDAEGEIIDQTRRLLGDEPALRTSLDTVRGNLATYRRDVAEPLIAATRANGPSPEQARPDERARTIYLTASGSITDLADDLSQRRNAVRNDVAESGRAVIALLIGAAAIVIVAGIGLAALLRRLVTQPVVDLATQVRRVARGDYEYEIRGTADGPPELSRLARDVNAMRQQITRDLSVVRNAREQIEEANRQLEQQAEELTRSNRDLEQFAYVASHDLQEPLRKVASFCQLLQRRYEGQLDERADQYIGFAVDGAQRMQRLINDLLAFSRIGRMTSGFTDIDLNRLVVDTSLQFDTLREETGAEITFEDLPTVRGEEPLLGALFANLIGNALKFRHPDRTPRVHFSATQIGEEWEISCQDNGIGIAPEFADKVFVIFQRLHAKETYPGTGIGLAIAKKIVEYHGGRIWIDPDHEGGTLFRFTLPIPADVDDATPDAGDDQPTESRPVPARTVEEIAA